MEEDWIVIQEELANLVEFSNRNGMKFNSRKYKVMHLGSYSKQFCCKMGIRDCRKQRTIGTIT